MFVTFVIPTKGRPSLEASLQSLVAQTDSDWQAIVIRDGVKTQSWLDGASRVHYIDLPYRVGHENRAALVRNVGLCAAQGEWIANLDDDDTLDKHYVEWLRASAEDADLIHFRAQFPNGSLRPNYVPKLNEWEPRWVCNAFAFRRSFARKKQVWFSEGPSDDWTMVRNLFGAFARPVFVDKTAYFIGQKEQ